MAFVPLHVSWSCSGVLYNLLSICLTAGPIPLHPKHDSIELPTKNVAYDGIELHGENLCAAKLTYADGVHPAISLDAKVVDGKNLRVTLPWDRPRVDNSILMRTARSFTRIKMSLLPIDETSRQILVHDVKAKVFK